MRKIIVSEFVTLDGVMQDPGGSEGFERGGWNLPYMDETAVASMLEELQSVDIFLYGAVTYKGFAESWPHIEAGELSKRINGSPKYVVSPDFTDQDLTWNDTTLIKDNPIKAITELKQQPGQDILVYGSATLVQTLIQHDLVDEYHLRIHPIILGKGKKIFQDGLDQKELKLTQTKTTPSGLVMLTYERKTKS